MVYAKLNFGFPKLLFVKSKTRWLPFKAVLLSSVWVSHKEKLHCPRKFGRGGRNKTVFLYILFPVIVCSDPKSPKQRSKRPRQTIYLFIPDCFWLGMGNYNLPIANKQGHRISLCRWEKEKRPLRGVSKIRKENFGTLGSLFLRRIATSSCFKDPHESLPYL